MSIIGKKKLPKLPSETGPLASGKILLVDKVDYAPNDGMYSMNATLTCRTLNIGMCPSPK